MLCSSKTYVGIRLVMEDSLLAGLHVHGQLVWEALDEELDVVGDQRSAPLPYPIRMLGLDGHSDLCTWVGGC